jgi:hypothetical protein
MKNKVLVFQGAGRLTCRWVLTGNRRAPLACVWTEPKAVQTSIDASSNEKTGRMHLCA